MGSLPSQREGRLGLYLDVDACFEDQGLLVINGLCDGKKTWSAPVMKKNCCHFCSNTVKSLYPIGLQAQALKRFTSFILGHRNQCHLAVSKQIWHPWKVTNNNSVQRFCPHDSIAIWNLQYLCIYFMAWKDNCGKIKANIAPGWRLSSCQGQRIERNTLLICDPLMVFSLKVVPQCFECI